MRFVDLRDKVHLSIDGNSIPAMLVELCKIQVCPSAKDTLKPDELMGIADSIISRCLEVMVQMWNQDLNFRNIVIYQLIANSQLDILCDTKKHMN
jgi:hypothetical protein